MKIGYDVSQTGKTKAGCGYLADNLIRKVTEVDTENEYILYPTFGDFFWDPRWRTDTWQGGGRSHVRQGPGQRTLEEMREFWTHPPADWETQLGSPDVIHSNNFYCPVGLERARLVYTLYDLGFIEDPEWTTEENRIGCFTGAFQASIRADLIIAISRYTRDHFLENFPHYPADRVSVIYPASRLDLDHPAKRPDRLDFLQPDEFWLHVGTIEPRKNLTMLLEACALLRSRQGAVPPLVLTGGEGWLMDDFDQQIDSYGLRDRVVRAGYVDDEALSWLYRNCVGLVFPSHFEGFGMPVLEAMSLGSVPIACDSSSIPELVGDAGLLIPPRDTEALVDAMSRLSSDPQLRGRLRNEGLQRSKVFTWQSAAQRLLDAYSRASALAPRYRHDSSSSQRPE